MGQTRQGLGRGSDAVGAKDQAHHGEAPPQGRAELLGGAAADSDKGVGIVPVAVGDAPDFADHFLLWFVAHRAGEKDKKIGVCVRSRGETFRNKGTGEPVAVADVHLAAHGRDVKFHSA